MEIFLILVVVVIAWLMLSNLVRGFKSGLKGEDEPQTRRSRGTTGGRVYPVEAVGESHYQAALAAICGGRSRDGVEQPVTATLILESSNPYDKDAVRVEVDGHAVGYLPRAAAKTYRKRLKKAGRGDSVQCPAIVRGGWDRGSGDQGNFGIWLDLRI